MNQYNELFAALAKAQAAMQTAGMNSANPFFKSKYADFAEIVRASRPSLAANGLCVIQRIVTATDGMTLCTMLGHSSGQYIESEIRISPAKADVQSLGSYITYLKRYAYAAIVGVIISDEDDDGEYAMAQERKPAPRPEFLTVEQYDQLQHELQDMPEFAQKILDGFNIKTLSQLPKSAFLKTIDRIREVKANSK